MTEKVKLCTDQCKHCIYIEEGDFMCSIKKEITIEGWKPKVCTCHIKRRRIK